MAKYTVTRSCGHEETVALIGPGSKREWRLEHVEPYKLCYECYQKDLQRRREEANKEAAETAKEADLPQLTGSEKQIAWAETIRQGLLSDLDEFIHVDPRKDLDILMVEEGYQSILSKTSASWWIDHRHIKGERLLESLLKEECKAAKAEQMAPPKEVVMDALVEATVRPETPKTETVAEISILENTIEIKFPERREDFRKIMRSKLKMDWSGASWKRKLVWRNGKDDDRAAEVGHRLLAAGFIIRIFDEVIRQKAITGNYEQECTNWVLTFDDDSKYAGLIGIRWGGGDYFIPARKLPGSRWDKPYMIVRPDHYEQILDFAQLYDFRVSKTAQRLLDAAREAKRRTLVAANIEPPVEVEYISISGTPPVLEVPKEVEIADEFKD